MSELEIHIENLHRNIGEEIKRKINRGIVSSIPDLHDEMEDAAQNKITKKRAVFSGELQESFVGSFSPASTGWDVRLRNVADHASYVDQGVRGTRSGTGPHAYTSKRPPLTALLPWVEAKLGSWTIIELPDGQKKLVPKE